MGKKAHGEQDLGNRLGHPEALESPELTMSSTEAFLEWLQTQHREAAFALHDGNVAPKLATWTTEEPMTLFGAFWFEASTVRQAQDALVRLAEKFSDCSAYSYDLIAYGVSDHMAYTVGHERAAMRVDGEPSEHYLRVTQVYRREGEVWKVVHRHADDATPRVARDGMPG